MKKSILHRGIGVLGALLVMITSITSAATYEIGTGRTYPTIGAFPWEDRNALQPGDIVRIYYNGSPYKEKLFINQSGTPASPITIQGVPDSGGNLPVIDGENATTRSQIDMTAYNHDRGVVILGAIRSGYHPENVIVENLEIIGADRTHSFTDDNGGSTAYADGAASLHVRAGNNITIRDCILHNSEAGIGTIARQRSCTNLVIEGCYVYDNGRVGDIYRHNVYIEGGVWGLTVQYNRLGPTITGASGNNLKTRAAGTVIRYNWVEDGAYLLDLCEGEIDDSRKADPFFDTAYVYGNILKITDGGGNRIVRFGGDTYKTEDYYRDDLFFYNNTLVSLKSGSSDADRTRWFRLWSGATVDMRNCILYADNGGNMMSMQSETYGTMILRNNWLSTGWLESLSGDCDIRLISGNIDDGTSPGFTAAGSDDFSLAIGSACIDQGTPLSSSVLPTHNVVMEYVRHLTSATRPTDTTFDIGADEYGVYVPPSTPPTITSADATPNPALTGQSVSFSATATGDTPITYLWTFGDGDSASGSDVSHAYASASSFSASVVASNTHGSDTNSFSVTVTEPGADTNLVQDFEVWGAGGGVGSFGTHTNSDWILHRGRIVDWATPTRGTFSALLEDYDDSPGAYLRSPLMQGGASSVTFWCRNDRGEGANMFNIDVSANDVDWSTVTSLVHTDSTWTEYNVAIDVATPTYVRFIKTGDTNTSQELVLDDIAFLQDGGPAAQTNPPVITSADATPNPVLTGQSVSFSATATGDTPITYLWTFGDGDSASGSDVSHSYSSASSFSASVVASNAHGDDTNSFSVTVTEPAAQTNLVQDFEAWGAGGDVGSFGTHTNSDWILHRGRIIDWVTPHLGSFCALLEDYDNNPGAYLRSPLMQGGAASVTFWCKNDRSEGANMFNIDVSANNVDWSTVTSIVHTNSTWTEYNVALGVSTPTYVRFIKTGDTNTSQELTLDDIAFLQDEAPVAQTNLPTITSADATPNPALTGQSVSFSASATGDSPITYLWTFGDGDSASGSNVSHTYTSASSFSVSVVASNTHGSNTNNFSVTVTAPGAGTNLVQDFEAWAAAGDFNDFGTHTNSDWILHGGRILDWDANYYHSPSNGAQLGDYDDAPAYPDAYLRSPLMQGGASSVTFWCRNDRGAGANMFNIDVSANDVDWSTVTSIVHTNSTWTEYNVALGVSTPTYVRFIKTGDTNSSQELTLDDIAFLQDEAPVAQTNLVQDFEAWGAGGDVGSFGTYTNSDWILHRGRIIDWATPTRGTFSALLEDYDDSPGAYLRSPLMEGGASSVTFWCRNDRGAGANMFNIDVSANDVDWNTVTSLVHTDSTWTEYNVALDVSTPTYVRFIKTGDTNTSQELVLDDISFLQNGGLVFNVDVGVSSTTATFGWTAEIGEEYAVYYCDDLVATSWVEMIVVTAATTSAEFDDTGVSGVPARYYQLRKL